MEDVDLLRAALALAALDGKLTGADKGLIEGLAARIGVGKASLDAMMAQAGKSDAIADNILIKDPAKARDALRLLVAEADLSGEVSPAKRSFLVRVANQLKITGDEFEQVYASGLKHAEAARQRHAAAAPHPAPPKTPA